MPLRTAFPICLVLALAAAAPAFAEHTHTRYGEVIGNISRTNGGIIQRGPTHQLVGHLADAETASLHLSALHARAAAATDDETRAALAKEAGVWSGELADALDRAASAAREGLTPDAVAERLADETDTDRRAALEQDLARGCAMTTLSPEVARADPEMHRAYEAKMTSIAGLIANGLSGGTDEARRARAWAMLSTLIGGLTLSRAVANPEIANGIAAAARTAALAAARA